MNLPDHKTKIVCTIGPASRSETVLEQLIEQGMNVARLNFAHGTLQGHKEDIRRIRAVAERMAKGWRVTAFDGTPLMRGLRSVSPDQRCFRLCLQAQGFAPPNG